MKRKRYIYYIIVVMFLAGIHEGKIAIWQADDPQPKYLLPYSADLLPQTDRSALAKGIRIHSREELTRFLEDFCS